MGAVLLPGGISRAGVSQPELEKGLIGYWKFDEGTGDKAMDSSPFRNNGVLQFGPQWMEGKLGKALRFNGGNALVEIPHQDVLKRLDQITLSAWVRLLGPADQNGERLWHGIIGTDGWFSGYRLLVRDTDQVILFQLTGKEGHNLISATKLQADAWHHLVGTYDGKLMKLYINAQKDPNERNRAGAIDPNTSSVYIGRPQFACNGIIDDVRLYNRSLSGTEIEALYKPASFQ